MPYLRLKIGAVKGMGAIIFESSVLLHYEKMFMKCGKLLKYSQENSFFLIHRLNCLVFYFFLKKALKMSVFCFSVIVILFAV